MNPEFKAYLHRYLSRETSVAELMMLTKWPTLSAAPFGSAQWRAACAALDIRLLESKKTVVTWGRK